MKRILILIVCIGSLMSCNKINSGGDGTSKGITPYYLLNEGDDFLNSHAGETSRSSLTYVGGSFRYLLRDVTNMDMSIYPRFIKTTDGWYLMFYHNGTYNRTTAKSDWSGTHCAYARSRDMLNWEYCGPIFSEQKNAQSAAYGDVITRTYAGAFPVRLSDGRLMVVASYRRDGNYRVLIRDNGLAFKFSDDEGKTWTKTELRINVGTNWEPFALVLPEGSDHPGRVIVYYTDSCPWIPVSEGLFDTNVISTGVSYIYSDDNGKTWLPEDSLNDHIWAYRQVRPMKANGVKVYTDQMPGVINLNCSKQLVGTGEAAQSVPDSPVSYYHVSLAYSEQDGTWGEPDADNVMPRERVNALCMGAAPQIYQFPSGEVVLTYNAVYDGRNMFIYRLGNEKAKDLSDEYRFFPGLPKVGVAKTPSGAGFWGAVLIEGHLMLAGVGGSGGSVGLNSGMQIGQYYLNHNITASRHEFKVDGDNSEWKTTDQALFVGSKDNVHATLRTCVGNDRIAFLVEVDGSSLDKSDYAQLYFASPSGSTLSVGDFFVKASLDGTVRTAEYRPGWFTVDSPVQTAVSRLEGAYLMEISLPLSLLPLQNGEILVNLQVGDKVDGAQSIVDMSTTATDKWIKIKNL